jgi:hypothetical protein
MISRATMAAAARVIEYAAARPIVLCADLTQPTDGIAKEAEAATAQVRRTNGPILPRPHP